MVSILTAFKFIDYISVHKYVYTYIRIYIYIYIYIYIFRSFNMVCNLFIYAYAKCISH